MSRMKVLMGVVAVGAGWMAGCGEDGAPEEATSQVQQPIRNAYESNESRVVALTANGKMCSGVLVSPSFVLTAAHCFIGHNGYQEFAASEGMGLEVPSVSVLGGQLLGPTIATYA